MSIGSQIKRLRRERDITQEQLADYLGITSRAVSQWECDRTAPDISQLPLLANIFEVSADVLLGIDNERKNERIKQILKAAMEMNGQAQWEKESEYLREQLKKYPNSYSIMEKLADALVNDYSRKGIKDYDEVITLCSTVLSECTDDSLRHETLQLLGYAYLYAGKYDKMIETAELMTESRYSKESFLLWSVKGDKGFEQNQNYMAQLIEEIAQALSALAGSQHDNGDFIYSISDRITIWKQLVSIIEVIFPDGDYHIKAQHAEIASSCVSKAYFRTGEIDDGFIWLEKACRFAIEMDTYDCEAVHTSPALRGNNDGGWIKENGCNRTYQLLNGLLEDESLGEIKNDIRFKNIIDELNKYAIKN